MMGTLAGNRRLNGSAFAGGHLALRLASGEGVVVVVVVGGLIVEKWRKIRGMCDTASLHQLLFVVVVVVIVVANVGFSVGAGCSVGVNAG